MRKVQSWILIGVIALFVVGFRAGKMKNIAKIETTSEATSLAAYAGILGPVSGALTGTVTYAGVAPAVQKLQVTKDVQVCGKEPHYDESLIVANNKGIKNVVVLIISPPKGKDLKSLGMNFELHQTGCVFLPHVQIVPVGVPLKIFNNDGILHNFHTYSQKNPPINVAQPKFKKVIEKTFTAAEVVSVKCDVHGWMSGYIVVVDHSYYAITDANGQFRITEVPAGNYQVEFWHEKLGKIRKEIKVTAGAEIKLDLVYPAAGK